MGISLTVDIKKIASADKRNILLENINLELRGPGIVWIKGLNGAGKSVLANTISGKAFFKGSGLHVEGKITLETPHNKTVIADSSHSPDDYAENVTFMPQKLASSLLAIHYQDDICFGLEGTYGYFLEATRREKYQQAVTSLDYLLNALNVWAHLTKKIGSTSYGETRRMEFATVLSPFPFSRLVVLDEPFSGLDPNYQEMFARIISEFADLGESIWVISSHEDLHKFHFMMDNIVVYDLDSQPSNQVTAQKTRDTFRAVAQAATDRFSTNPLDNQHVLELRDVMIEWKKPHESRVELLELSATPGTVTWLEGNNGCGKSSIAKVLAGLLGKSRLRKTVVSGIPQGGPYGSGTFKAPNEKVRIALQDPFDSFVYRTVIEDLEKPHSLLQAGFELPASLCASLNEGWGVISRRPSTFSFGQLKFLELLLFPPSTEVVIFDEPLLGINPLIKTIMLSTLVNIARSGRIVICTCQRDQIDADKNNIVYRLPPLE